MPELPEVETVVRGLNKLIIGKKIIKISSDNYKSFPISQHDSEKFILNATVLKVSRRAKIIIINLSSAYSLVVHLKMTGQLVYKSSQQSWGGGHPSDSLVNNLPDKSTRVTITFDDNSKLFFNDQRKFGWMKLFQTTELPAISSLAKLGPEPLEAEFTEKIFLSNLHRRLKSKIKPVLLDQTIISGIGNIYADESLFKAKIHPESIVGQIPQAKLKKLRKAIVEILNYSIEKGGSTSQNYVNAEGKRGNYLDFAAVYGRSKLDCIVCQAPITKIKLAGRGTHICLKCQKKYTLSSTE
ncbi:DNA-formamidopyrimidine glycosylase [Candidatus Saccharibacteria bacterium]|nr:DNA-formamidopyrimidine glycosylase [Candidatus Saccharibacteria bacterium]